MQPLHILFALYAVICVAAYAWLVRWERRKYIAMNKGAAWLRVRLASLPMLLVVAAVVAIPTSQVSGMEGLAVFYLLLLGAGPLVWCAGHWLVGKFTRPPLSFGESSQIALSPIVLLFVLGWLGSALQPIAWLLLGVLGFQG